jgi:hypothetical protein
VSMTTRVARVSAAALTGTVLLSGCSMNWASMSPELARSSDSTSPTSPSPAAAEAPESAKPAAATIAQPAEAVDADAAAATSAPEAPRKPGDLDAGSLTHKLDAGERTLVVNYWTDQAPTTWTADLSATVQLSAHIEDSDDEHAVKVSRFLAIADDGVTRTTLTDDRASSSSPRRTPTAAR